MNEFKIKYDRARYPMQQKRADGTLGCRGCGGKIPKGRLSWCSNACAERFTPRSVLFAVFQRDKGVCCVCGLDSRKARQDWLNERGSAIASRTFEEWRLRKPPHVELDHIIPFSEGGLTVLENLRSLCSVCHKTRTAQWHSEKRQRRLNKPFQQLSLL